MVSHSRETTLVLKQRNPVVLKDFDSFSTYRVRLAHALDLASHLSVELSQSTCCRCKRYSKGLSFEKVHEQASAAYRQEMLCKAGGTLMLC